MLSIKEEGIMLYIIDYCKRIESKVENLSKKDFSLSKDIQEIICFNLLQIGELAKKLPQEFLSKNNLVPWNEIKGMRDRIVHGYGSIKMERVWDTATKDVKPLRDYCESILKSNK